MQRIACHASPVALCAVLYAALCFCALLACTVPASAQTLDSQPLRDLCADRPGLDTPPCTVDKGHLVMETGLGDWTHEKDADTRTSTLTAGDLLLRLGVTDDMEVQAGWTAFGHVRERDRETGALTHRSGTGDLTLAVRQNLRNPDGSGFSAAVMPYVTLPTGGQATGAGDTAFGLLIPLSFSLSDRITLSLTPQADAAVDEDRNGRHLAYGSVAGLGVDLTDSLTGALEFQATRDDDPSGHMTQALASLSFGWQPGDNIQFDIGGVAGLNHDSPDAEIYAGITRRL
ncbi:MAG: transporter [Sphingobium phenoxybenzoativorans]